STPMSPRRKPGSIDTGLWNIGPSFHRVTAGRVASEDILLIPRPQTEFLARLGRREGAAAQQLDDVDRLLDELAVRGEDACFEEEVALEPHPDIAAEQHRLRDHRHLHAADAEAGPVALLRQLVDEGFHRGRIGRRAPGNAEADLEERCAL